jgi:hypothetical protein
MGPDAGRRVPARVGVGAAVALVAVLAGCAGPAVTDDGYRNKAGDTVQTVQSAVASAQLAGGLELAGRSGFAVTDAVVSGAESDASSAQDALASRQPPDAGSRQLYSKIQKALRDGVDGLRDLRIAVRDGDRDGMRGALKELGTAAGELAQAEKVTS